MTLYDVDSPWDDPFEHLDERRQHPRFKFSMKLSVARQSDGMQVVGPAKVRDLCLRGYCAVTKHAVEPGDAIVTRFPTTMCPEHMCLPEHFTGSARVVRVKEERRRRLMGVVLNSEFYDNMEFALFIDFLHGQASVSKSQQAPPK